MSSSGMYDDLDRIAADVAAGRHRDVIGGMWDEVGALQLDFLRGQGLKPDQRLLDVGCGSLRGGVHFVRYLDAGGYYGLDISEALIEAGYTYEIGALGLKPKLPRTNLITTATFDATPLGAKFDMALAQSVFTHLPLNLVALCLEQTARVMKPGGVFYATFFRAPEDAGWSENLTHQPGGVVTTATSDPYHYKPSQMAWAAGDLWEARCIGEWSHPRGQQMMAYTRTG
jgi:SAM-dependent methyltransferase